MKKQEIIALANKDHNPVWELVHILEDEGRVEKISTETMRKPAVPISANQMLVNLSANEILIATVDARHKIENYRLLKYNADGTVDGIYKK
ncbi:hypothetical protein [Streptococcus uberis]|uniref:hypothetical protein n=1 Tax=Streptococcus uberis TaxID=1349 RepID=UPI0006203CA7|nr:hypothetical protein [Streptococcus uberis]KKF60596.1 hypothetical protein AF58_00430 [Streptococcus uberis C6344]